MSDLLLGALSALLATNTPAALSNLVRSQTGLALPLPNAQDPVEREYQRLLELDDDAQEEVQRWVQERDALHSRVTDLDATLFRGKVRARYEPVKQAYDAFLKDHPGHARARLAYGSFLGDIGEEDLAHAQWIRAAELDPRNPATWNNLANHYGHNGPVTNAFACYARALALRPQEALYYQNYATTLFLFRHDARAYFGLTEAQVFAKALALYREARRLDPDNFVLATDLAQTYYPLMPKAPPSTPAERQALQPVVDDALAAWEDARKVASEETSRQGVRLHQARWQINAGRFEAARQSLAQVTNAGLASTVRNLSNKLAKLENPAPATNPPLQQIGRTEVLWRGRRLAYFAGCDYFRLGSHPAVRQALVQGLRRFGLNAAASRRTTGNHRIYAQLERALARLAGAEAAVLLSNGYLTNLAAVQALDGEFTHVLADERAHCSLQDAARWSGRPVRFFPHRDAPRAARLARQLGRSARVLVLTDGLFAHSGEVAPIDQLLRQLPRSARLIVDDCHGLGTLGRSGGGTLEHLGVQSPRIVRTVTLSKALGVYGGAVLGPAALCRKVMARSAVFMGNTPLPFPLAAAALAAVERVWRDRGLRRRLADHLARVREALAGAGLALPDGPGPILPIHPADARQTRHIRQRLLAAGIHPPFIRYAGNPEGYFRIVLSSEHSPAQLDGLARALLQSLA